MDKTTSNTGIQVLENLQYRVSTCVYMLLHAFFLSQNLSFPAQDAINLDAEERSPRI